MWGCWLFPGAGWLFLLGEGGSFQPQCHQGVLSAPLPMSQVLCGSFRAMVNAPVWPLVVFLSLSDIWCIAVSSQKEALMEDVRVGRKELTLLLKGNRNGNVSGCF